MDEPGESVSRKLELEGSKSLDDAEIEPYGDLLAYLQAYPWAPHQTRRDPGLVDRVTWRYLLERRLLGHVIEGSDGGLEGLDQTEVLVPFTPYRADQEPLLYPVIVALRDRGYGVTLLLGREAPADDNLDAPQGIQVVREEAIPSFDTYRSAKDDYRRLPGVLRAPSTASDLDQFARLRTRKSLQKWVWNRAVMDDLLGVVQPGIIYGLYFGTGRPGFLTSIRRHRESGVPRVFLQQHGVITPRSPPDFHGADEILLWGDHQRTYLERWADDLDATLTVTGNPKVDSLTRILDTPATDRTGEARVLFVSNPDSVAGEEVNELALEIFQDAAREAQGWHPRYRPHPVEDLDKFSLSDHEAPLDRGPIDEVLTRIDVVVGRESTLLLEAVATGRPMAQVATRPGGVHADFAQLSAWDDLDVPQFDSGTALARWLNEITTHPKRYEAALREQRRSLEQVFDQSGGRAAERIANRIHQVCERYSQLASR